MAKTAGLDWRSVKTLGQLHAGIGGDRSLIDMNEFVSKHLSDKPYDRNTICELLGVTEAEMESILSANTKNSASK